MNIILSFRKPVATERQPMPAVDNTNVYSVRPRELNSKKKDRASVRTGVGHIAKPAAKEQERRKGELKRTNDPGCFARVHIKIFLDVRQSSEQSTEVESVEELDKAEDCEEGVFLHSRQAVRLLVRHEGLTSRIVKGEGDNDLACNGMGPRPIYVGRIGLWAKSGASGEREIFPRRGTYVGGR